MLCEIAPVRAPPRNHVQQVSSGVGITPTIEKLSELMPTYPEPSAGSPAVGPET